ncbi:hypothetical protein BP6252_14003 [Coleophoma cylindrospora]|uniref:Uncharacterized protein n=1 Tax=Coleophoma cylindrospora TaxID=1849047 RepID=A0A3D8Q512_9HELO|nr:hypothetical protein BP6252_14003 [Coleophoma cylindrospora]
MQLVGNIFYIEAIRKLSPGQTAFIALYTKPQENNGLNGHQKSGKNSTAARKSQDPRKRKYRHAEPAEGCKVGDRVYARINADKDSPSGMGQTPIQLAVSERHIHVVQTLLASGASVAMPKGTESLLHIAARVNHGAIVKELLDYGAKLELSFKRGGFDQAPLHVAVQYNCADAARELLNHGARTDIRGNFNRTPILQALILDEGGSHVPLIKLLLEAGAEFDHVE